VRRFLDARAERAAERDRATAARMGWRGLLAQRTPLIRAAAKRRRRLGQAQLVDGRGWRSLRSSSGRFIVERRVRIGKRTMILWEGDLVWYRMDFYQREIRRFDRGLWQVSASLSGTAR
jgi:hypothetical protein